jgi:F-type H+-transporting ATPase subunit delta
MASVDDRALALGRLYAGAILDLAEEQGRADELLDEMQELARFLEQRPEIEEYLASPMVDDAEHERNLERMFRGRASDLLVDALQVVRSHGRLGWLRAIAEAYRLEYRDRRGLIDARVRTAVPLPESERARLIDAVARFSGKQPTLFEKVDPSLIGGMIVEVGGMKIDTSLASRLRDLGAALERRSSQEILRGAAYME